MRQILYISERVGPTDDLSDILDTSRRNNPDLGLTGLLVSLDGQYVQILEGPGEVVSLVMETIADDSRHRGFALLLDRMIEERDFGAWSMASLDPDTVAGLRETVHLARGAGAGSPEAEALRDLMAKRHIVA